MRLKKYRWHSKPENFEYWKYELETDDDECFIVVEKFNMEMEFEHGDIKVQKFHNGFHNGINKRASNISFEASYIHSCLRSGTINQNKHGKAYFSVSYFIDKDDD